MVSYDIFSEVAHVEVCPKLVTNQTIFSMQITEALVSLTPPPLPPSLPPYLYCFLLTTHPYLPFSVF